MAQPPADGQNVEATCFRSFDHLLACRRQLRENERIHSTDAVCCASFPGSEDRLWISSPNMCFVPEPPYHSPSEPLRFYVDGMLGKHEYLKWPQAFYQGEIHSIGAPMHPKLLDLPQETEKYGNGPYAAAPEQPRYFTDLSITWERLEQRYFVKKSIGEDGIRGLLHPDMSKRLDAAMAETTRLAHQVAETLIEVNDARSVDAPSHLKSLSTSTYLFQRSRYNQLHRCYNLLSSFPMLFPDLLMWFREFQRLLLDVRGWIIWYLDVRPRLQDPDFNQPFPVLPIRGAFTSDLVVLDELFRVGVPVWFIRDRGSMTTNMFVNRVKIVIGAGRCFNLTRAPSAPLFSDAPGSAIYSPLELQAALRKFSILQKPVLLPAKSWDPKATIPSTSARANPANEVAAVKNSPAAQPYYEEDPMPNDFSVAGVKEFFNEELGPIVDESPIVDDQLDRQIASLAALLQDRARIHDKSVDIANKPGLNPSDKRTPPPAWLHYPASIAKVEQYARTYLRDDNSRALLYYLPPLHLFFSDPTSPIASEKLHNWLRVRTWCFDQIRRHAEVLMTTGQWRTALEGRYYAVPYDHLQLKGELRVTPEQINRLPLPPPDIKRRRHDPEAKHRKNGITTQHKRVASRLEINVRFGLSGGFAPYDASEKVSWGIESLDAADIARSFNRIAPQVVWELSVASFRLELLDLDRALLPKVYAHPDPAVAARREMSIGIMWKNGWVRPAWESETVSDLMSSRSWEVRVQPIQQFASIVRLWPGGSTVSTWDLRLANDEKAFEDFEYKIFLFYAETFTRVKGRRPALPFVQPADMNGSA